MPAARALSTNQIEYKNILIPIEGTDPVEYSQSSVLVSFHATLDMETINSISTFINEYGEVEGHYTVVTLNNGQTVVLDQSYEEVNSLYINYLNGG
jgi:competence transcription factor ComK